jgi:hypothetical protein
MPEDSGRKEGAMAPNETEQWDAARASEIDRAAGSPRAEARKHIEKRRALQGGLVAYVVVNAFLVAVWAMSGGGYFWPVWVMAAWGLGMVFGVWDYLRRPVSEADVDAELRRMQSRGR